MWGSLGGLNEEPVGWKGWIFCVNLSLPLLFFLAMGVWLKEYSGVTVYLFAKLHHFSAKWKIPIPLRLILKTMYNLFESCETRQHTTSKKYFQSRGKGTDRPSENTWDGRERMLVLLLTQIKNQFKTAFKEAWWSWVKMLIVLGVLRRIGFLSNI